MTRRWRDRPRPPIAWGLEVRFVVFALGFPVAGVVSLRRGTRLDVVAGLMELAVGAALLRIGWLYVKRPVRRPRSPDAIEATRGDTSAS